jgi:aspartate/methionine/tyrosine aminotransferase
LTKYKIDSLEFCKRLLKEKQIAITPGIDFGSNNTDKFVRISYTKNIEELKIASQRIKEFVRTL